MKSQNEMRDFMNENGIDVMYEPVWISDFFMNFQQGNVIRDLKPVQVFIEKKERYMLFYKIGKKGQKLTTTISAESASNGWMTSSVPIFENEEEANKEYIKRKEDYLEKYSKDIDININHLNKLKNDLAEFKK